MPEMPEVVKITEQGVLRAMAHPLRTRLYYTLLARGAARATDLARELDVPGNQVSFHLRLMAKYGLIQEAPEYARDKRDRVWQPASTMGIDPDEALTAAPAYQEARRRAAHHVLEAYLAQSRPGFHHSNDITVHLSSMEVEQFASDLQDLLMRWNQTGQANAATDPETVRTTYLATVHIQPLPVD